MQLTGKQKHNLGVVMLAMTAMFWGAGFVVIEQMLDVSFYNTPALINAIRFSVATLCLLAIFNKKIRFNKHVLLYGGIGGLMLFAGFLLQIIGQKYTTPSHSGFFTATYVAFVPFIAWIVYKRRPSWVTFCGIALAIVGFVVLNFSNSEATDNTWIGDILTLSGAVMFALQIVWADYALKKSKIDYVQMTFWQVAFSALLFVLYTLTVESVHYSTMTIDIKFCWWRLAIVTLGGTAFAYYAQTFAQKHVSASTTSLILSCESPIGAFLSMILLIEDFSWRTVIGGLMIFTAVVLVEVVSSLICKKRCCCKENSLQVDTCDTPNEENTCSTPQLECDEKISEKLNENNKT